MRVPHQRSTRKADDGAVHRPLTEADRENLAKLDQWVAGHIAEPHRGLYDTRAGKIRTLQVILDQGLIRRDEGRKLRALGATFGAVLAEELGLAWEMREAEGVATYVLRDPGTPIVLYPMTMISKRVAEGEVLDIAVLVQTVARGVEEIRAEIAAEEGGADV